MTSILQLNNLTKIFAGNVTAVNDISMTVEDGEFITMLGPSGCGKTTMLRMIGGFEYPDSGSVFLDGRDITDTPPYERPVNMMFQDYALFPHMTVEENVAFGLKDYEKGRRSERITQAMEHGHVADSHVLSNRQWHTFIGVKNAAILDV